TNEEGGVDKEEYCVAAVKDRVDTTMQVWMGLTMGCAKCHSHKYDPIAQREYYEFYAFFNETEDANRGDEFPTLPTPTPEETKRIEDLNKSIAGIEKALQTPDPSLASAEQDWETQVKSSAKWVVAGPISMQSASGSRLVAQLGGAVLAKGDGPATETYTLKFSVPLARIAAVRLEALPDPLNPKGGVGRSRDDGNFVLTGISLTSITSDGKETPIPLTKAAADFSQAKYPVADALNNRDPKHHGWAVAPHLVEPHVAVFSTDAPSELPSGALLKLTLDHQFEFSYPGFSLGKFRVSFTDQADAGISLDLPKNIAAIL